MKDLKFTGEFAIPDKTPKNEWLRHVERYKFAAKFVKGKKVLDVACGTGYGSQILLDSGAKEVIGVDVSKDAISYAKKNYSAKFLLMDATKMKALKRNYFDIVVSMETIEHVKTWEMFIGEIKRVLKPNGAVVMSAPNFTGYPFEKFFKLNTSAKFHWNFFTKEQFIKIFNKNFKKTTFFYQDKKLFAFPARGIIEKIFRIERDHSIRKLESINFEPQTVLGAGQLIKKGDRK